MNTWPAEAWILRNVPGMRTWRRRYLAWRVLRAVALVGAGFALARAL